VSATARAHVFGIVVGFAAMSERLTELRRRLGESRRRLEVWAERLAALRMRVGTADTSAKTPAPVTLGAPLFNPPPGRAPGTGALDDVELTFEVLDTDDPGRGR
jgi:hypothetical protein